MAVHKNTRKRTFEYTGAEKQTAEKVRFRHFLLFSFFLLSHTKLLTSIAYKRKQLSYFMHRTSLSHKHFNSCTKEGVELLCSLLLLL